MYGEIPAEKESDFKKPYKDSSLSYWVIPDTKGSLRGLLHFCRRYEYCKDVIVLISKQTPSEYVNYLKEREYDFHIAGENEVDLPAALALLSDKYDGKRILADTGRILSNLLIEKNLVSEISLLIHPIIVGVRAYNIFSNINRTPALKLRKKQVFPKGYIWLVYDVT